ncbi:P-loop NTPase fold protein [Vreelandella boliviensis]|uniref:P-loop NTPase fold protein n=1 Tax=Vreelandella boliviensis TaxID=223527 RepID=UPI001B8B55C5|nr:P-loop NTPase fold protein [Halomonas boliviensis]MBS3667093.1 hypothetical protein [Halomonas boliviensis]
MEEVNRHVGKYLDYYLDLKEPGYSVLINAKWGAGKTFYIRRYLKRPQFKDGNQFAYVSLNGLGDIHEVYEALIAVFMPLASNKGAKITGSLLGSLLKYNSISVDLSLKDFVSPIRRNKFYVLDDLERYHGDIEEVFGFISALLEQDGVKVIILANEEKLKEGGGKYSDNKEKVIGKTLNFHTDFKDASDCFLKEVAHKKGFELLERKLSILREIFLSSGYSNLRLLRQAIYEVVDVLAFFENQSDDNYAAFETFLGVYFCLFFEYHVGNISSEDILHRKNYMMQAYTERSKNYKPSAFDKITEKYKEIELRSDVLTNEALHYFVVNGLADSDKVNGYILESPYFASKSAEPEWRVIWHWYDRDEGSFYDALKILDSNFEGRKYKDPSEVLHVFSSRLWLAKNNFVPLSYDDTLASCFDYIEDFFHDIEVFDYFNDHALRSFYSISSLLDESRSSFGLGYTERDDGNFEALSNALLFKIKEGVQQSLHYRGNELLVILEEDVRRFYSLICSNSYSQTPYVEIPILSYIPEGEFCNTIVRSAPEERRLAFLALSTRLYDVRRGMKIEELKWLLGVRDILNSLLPSLSIFERKVIEAKIKNHIDRVLMVECDFQRD